MFTFMNKPEFLSTKTLRDYIDYIDLAVDVPVRIKAQDGTVEIHKVELEHDDLGEVTQVTLIPFRHIEN
jgi:hypothetical protein